MDSHTALVVIDLQNYYLGPDSSYVRYQESTMGPGVLSPIHTRVRNVVLPNVAILLQKWRAENWPVVYLGLAGEKEDRSDLIPTFRDLNRESEAAGFPDFYPLRSSQLAQFPEIIAPRGDEPLLWKTSFSGFASSPIDTHLRDHGIQRIVATGICTSLCVETTARDAVDHGYEVVMVEDAQADFSEHRHWGALQNSAHMLGGDVRATQDLV